MEYTNKMEPQAKRIEYIDALKGFAIICVVLWHTIQGYLNRNIWPDINWELHNVHNVISAFPMALFFTISGYVYSLVYFDSEKNLKKQKVKAHLIDFVWVYLIFNILIWGFKLMGGAGVNNQGSVSSIFMIWALPIKLYWYLYVLIAFYLVFIPLLQKRLDSKIIFALLVVLCIGSNFISVAWFQIHRIFYYAIFFWLGIYKQRNNKFMTQKWGVALMFLVALVLMFVFWNSEINFYKIPVANAIIAIGIVGICWFLFEKFLRGGGKVLSLCGKYCLEIYLIHCFITAGLRILGLGTKLMADMPILCLMVNFLVGLFLPILCAVGLKKLKLHQLLFKPYEYFRKTVKV